MTLEAISFAGHECIRLEGEAGADPGASYVDDPLRDIAPDGVERHRERWTVTRAGEVG